MSGHMQRSENVLSAKAALPSDATSAFAAFDWCARLLVLASPHNVADPQLPLAIGTEAGSLALCVLRRDQPRDG